ncbi:protein boule-like isoform X2 [Dysidea avara]|uniref:protein boule-like isoform X2 n=1 Tax=Dysidea avara TaxID=196820 RepID=UPI00331FE3FB
MLPTPSSYPVTEPSMVYSPLPQGVEIPNRVFVGGLAYNTTELELKNFFNQFGHVKDSKIITDRQGVSRGYGFVTFSTVEEAVKVQEQGYLYYNEKKLNVSKAIRKQGGQYSSLNQEYINGQSHWFNDTLMSDQEGAWLVEQQSNKQPFAPVMFSMYQPSTSHTGYHGNPPLFSPAHYYHIPPIFNGFYPSYLQHNYRSSSHQPTKDHFSESLTSGEDSEEQDNDIAELEAQTQQLSLREDLDNDKQDHVMVKRSRRLPRLRKPPHFFQPNTPFHPTGHQVMGGPGGYAPLLPTPHHMIQPLPPRYLQQHGIVTAKLT